jgi:predicted metal-dependent hydrolase
VDGKKYCVRERNKMSLAANRLAEVNGKMQKLVNYCSKKYSNKKNIIKLVEGYNPKKIYETLPTSEYTAYSENKGEKIAFCLNQEKTDNNNLIDPNTLMFVAIHELAHVASTSVGHKDEFWKNFKFLLGVAEEIGVYEQIDYKKKPVKYCGMTIADNPYYDY